MPSIVYQLLFFAVLLAILSVCLWVARLLVREPLNLFARNLILVMVALELVAAALHLMTVGGQLQGAWAWVANLQYERNLGAVFSSMQLMVVALLALLIGLFTPGFKGWQRGYWLLVASLFFYLGLDEFYSYHETFGGRVPSDAYQLPYGIGAVVFGLATIAAFYFGFRRERRVFTLLVIGLGITVASGVVIEKVVSEGFIDNDSSLRWMTVFEEVGEMLGATIALAALLYFAQAHLPAATWRARRPLLVMGAVGWAVWAVFALTFLAAVDLRLHGTPVQVEYADGEMSLLGYEVAPSILMPRDELQLTLYLRTNRPLTTDYSVSVHALRHPEIESVAQSDDLHVGPIPSTAWFPGVVIKRTIYVQLPRNLPVPASYWVMLRIWSGPWARPVDETTGLLITSAGTLRQIAPDSVVLASVPAVPAVDAVEPPAGAAYSFSADGFTLDGYTLPESVVETYALPVRFWWSTQRAVGRELTQFVHLIPQDGDTVQSFDSQPFGGRFPTSDWVGGMRFEEVRTIMLPPDFTSGTYDVYTGMYDVSTMERAPVTDAAGQPVQDNAIYLGTVEIAPNAEAEAERLKPRTDVCYALADTNSLNGDTTDTLVTMSTTTGETIEVGQTGTFQVEGMTLSADRAVMYAVDELEDRGVFGTIALEPGQFTPIGDALAAPEQPARNPRLYDSVIKDIDSIAYDPRTERLWGILQDEENLLFQINVETGEVVRDSFGEGFDYLKIDLSDLPAPGYNNVEDLTIHPETGEFVVIVGNDAYDSLLATIDFSTANLTTGLIHLTPLVPLISSVDGEPIRDVEGLSFAPDGTFYAVSTNNSNSEATYDVLWRVDPETGSSAPIGQFTAYVDFVDYEALACLSE